MLFYLSVAVVTAVVVYLLYGFAGGGRWRTGALVVEKPRGAHCPLSPLHPSVAATADDAAAATGRQRRRQGRRAIAPVQHHKSVRRPGVHVCTATGTTANTTAAVHYGQTESRPPHASGTSAENKNRKFQNNFFLKIYIVFCYRRILPPYFLIHFFTPLR